MSARPQPETVIAFNGQIDNPRNIKPTYHTIIWYRSLEATERQIKGLQLHETHKWPPYVVLLMKDDSFLKLNISESGSSVDVTRLTEIADLPPPSIQVQFTQLSQANHSCVDLKFAIAVCHGILSYSTPIINSTETQRRMSVSQLRQIFPLALFLSIVRKRLPINGSLIKDIQSLDCVNKFWIDIISSCQCESQLLWEESIVQKLHQEIQGGIHTAAREQLEKIIRQTNSGLEVVVNGEPTPDTDNRKKHIAASVTAWLEFSAYKAKPSALESWDREWDIIWRSEWQKNWKEGCSNARSKGCSQLNPDIIPQVLPADILSGHAAGRALIDISAVANAVKAPAQSLLNFQTGAPAGFKGIPGSSDTHSNTEYNWLGTWYSIHHPELKQPGKWLPVWEVARGLAWALAWESSEIWIDKAHPPPSHKPSRPSRPKLRIGRGAPRSLLVIKDGTVLESPRGSLSSESSRGSILQLAETQLQKLAAEARELFKLERPSQDPPERDTVFKGIAEHIRELSRVAWCETSGEKSQGSSGLNSDVRKYIQEKAGSEALSRDIWMDIYMGIWKATWQTSWEYAWTKVMRDTSDGFDKWGRKTGVRDQGEPLVSQIGSLESYAELQKYFSSGISKEDNYWRIRSAFKALDLLQKALSHSVPICYREAMTISYFPDRPFEFTTPNPSPGLKRLAKVIQQDKEEKINHRYLQSEIISKLPEKYNATKMMEEIWSTAIHAESNADFWEEQDSERDQSGDRAISSDLPLLKHNMGRITWARHQWHKAVDDLRRSRGATRRGMSTDSHSTR